MKTTDADVTTVIRRLDEAREQVEGWRKRGNTENGDSDSPPAELRRLIADAQRFEQEAPDDVSTAELGDSIVLAQRALTDPVAEDEKNTQAQTLLELASRVILFRTPNGERFARFPVRDHDECHPIRSREFKLWLGMRYADDTGKPAQSAALAQAIDLLDGRAQFNGLERTVHTRVADHNRTIYLDLGDGDWSAIEITSSGWAYAAHPPVYFRRSRGQLALPMPKDGGDIAKLRDFINVRDERDFRMIVAWLISALMPTGPYPLLVVHGEQGRRPAAGQTLEEFLEACDPVLGQRMVEFALVLPALPGVGAALDDEPGTLDSDDEEEAEEGTDADPHPAQSIRQALADKSPDERERYRRFVERLVERSPEYPIVIRTLAVRTLLHSIAAGLWPDHEWPELLANALRALAAGGDQPNEWERRAAASLAAVSLALLRTDVPRMSQRDERQLRYEKTSRALLVLLEERDPEQVQVLAGELPGRLAGAPGVDATERAVDEALRPPRGAERAARLLADEHGVDAHVQGGATIVLENRVGGLPEPQMVTALRLADEPGPVFARATTTDGREVLAAWCAPWLAVEKHTKVGKPMVRAWRLSPGQTLHAFHGQAVMPPADITSFAGADRPDEVADLLALADEDA